MAQLFRGAECVCRHAFCPQQALSVVSCPEVSTVLAHPPNCLPLSHAWSHLSHVWLCNHMDWSPPGSSVHGILQARILEWVTIPYPRGASQPRDWTHTSYDSCVAGGLSLGLLGKLSPHLTQVIPNVINHLPSVTLPLSPSRLQSLLSSRTYLLSTYYVPDTALSTTSPIDRKQKWTQIPWAAQYRGEDR